MKLKHVLWSRGTKTNFLLLSTATLLLAAPALRADSPSDLMEQGIYSEETKGDLDSAMSLYQKVVAQSKADQALAAQAQYHVGLCLYKEKKYTDAEAAFEAVVKEYSDQKDVVALAQKYLTVAHALLPAPWADNEEMRLDLKLQSGMKIGMAAYGVNSGLGTNGQKIWHTSAIMTAGGIQSVSRVEVDADTFAPIHSYWKHTLLGEAEVTYFPDHADLKTTGKTEIKRIDLDGPVIDNEESFELMRRLSLADGGKGSRQIVSGLGGAKVGIKWDVTGPEKVEVPAGSFNCYKIALNINQTFWISADANRYMVKFEGGGAIAELTKVTHHSPGEKVAYSDTNGISMIAPPGWIFDAEEVEKKGEIGVRIIDPEVKGFSSLAIKSLDELAPDEKKSLRDYAKGKTKQSAKILKDFQVREGSWQDRSVAGQAALSVMADYTDGKDKKVVYGVFSFTPANAVYFELIATAKDFDALKPQFDSIIDSYKAQ